MTDLYPVNGARLFEEAAKRRQGEKSSKVIWRLFRAGHAWRTADQISKANRIYHLAYISALTVLSGASENNETLRDVSVSYNKPGDIQLHPGNVDVALVHLLNCASTSKLLR